MTQAKEQAGGQQGLTDQAAAKVQDAASVAQEKASELREQGSAQLRDQFDERSNQAGAQMRTVAAALRRSSDDLGNDGNASASRLTGQAAARIDRLGGYLEQKSGDELMRDIETFARRRPWMLAGLGLLAGVAAARFVKASSEQRYGDYRQISQHPSTWSDRSHGRSSSYERSESLSGASSGDPMARDPYGARR